MTSKELAQEVAATILACTDRVVGIGSKQYSFDDGTQKFESMDLPELFDMASEELEDIIAYAVMLRIRLQTLKDVIHARTPRNGQDAER